MTVAGAKGSNVRDRPSHLEFACSQVQRHLSNVRVSTFRETTPQGVNIPQPDFLHAAAVGETDQSPQALLAALLEIERLRGRERPHPNAPRTLDLDLILFGGQILNQPGLRVPHPRFRDRAFVLEPLASIGRHLAGAFPVAVAYALLSRKIRWQQVLVVLNLAFFGLFTAYFAIGRWMA